MFWQKLWYNHWRKLTTVALALAVLAATALLLVFFPPALPFLVGLVAFASPLLTMAAPLAIALVSTIAAVGTFLVTAAIHKFTDLISKEIPSPHFAPNLVYFDEPMVDSLPPTKSLRYGKLGTLITSLGIGAVLAIGTGLVGGLAFGMAALTAPAWITVGAAFGIGMVASGVLHAFAYASNRYENHCRKELKIVVAIEGANTKIDKSLDLDNEPSPCFSFKRICGKLSKPFASKPKLDASVHDNDPVDEGLSAADVPPRPRSAGEPKLSKIGLFCSKLCRAKDPDDLQSAPAPGGRSGDL